MHIDERIIIPMRRAMLTRCVAMFCVIAAASSGRGDPDYIAPEIPMPIGVLVAALNSTIPSVRSAATHRLIEAGESARPQLRRALLSATPEMASRIKYILLHLQWVRDTDSDVLKQAMVGYADDPPEVRVTLIDEQLAQGLPATRELLQRIVLNDTCSTVRWEAAVVLAGALISDQDPIIRELDELVARHPDAADVYPLPSQNSALLALTGWGFVESNPPHAQALLDQAVALETVHPTAFGSQMKRVFGWLAARAVSARDFPRAAELFREQAGRLPWSEPTIFEPDSLFDIHTAFEPAANLFALHADFGPFPGFVEDLRNYRGYFVHPEMVYTIGRWLDRTHHPLLAAAANAGAWAMSGASWQTHYGVGIFLADQSWNTLAERELNTCLALPGGRVSLVYYQLSQLASQRDDEVAAAVYLDRVIALVTPEQNQPAAALDGTSAWTTDLGRAQVQWHYLRAAREAHDTEATKLRLDKLLELDQQTHALQRDPAMAADIVPALQDLGRRAEADRIFVDAYNALAAQVAAGPMKPMPKNNLAWLCACSERHLDEAIRLADEVVAMVPNDAECLDTQAEAYFRNGKIARALEIETYAVQIKPDDVYMQKQVKKYQAAVERVGASPPRDSRDPRNPQNIQTRP